MIAPKYAKAFDLIMEISYDDFKIYFVNDFGVLSESWTAGGMPAIHCPRSWR